MVFIHFGRRCSALFATNALASQQRQAFNRRYHICSYSHNAYCILTTVCMHQSNHPQSNSPWTKPLITATLHHTLDSHLGPEHQNSSGEPIDFDGCDMSFRFRVEFAGSVTTVDCRSLQSRHILAHPPHPSRLGSLPSMTKLWNTYVIGSREWNKSERTLNGPYKSTIWLHLCILNVTYIMQIQN